MTVSIGKQLRDKREQDGYTLEQASEAIRIKPAYLLALEENRLHDLPSMTHARGYLRSYADYLGLSSQSLLDELKRQESPEAPATELKLGSATRPEVTETAESVMDSTIQPSVPEAQPDEPEKASDAQPQTEAPSELSAAQIFAEIGSQIRTQRVALGLELDEVEKYTHIRSFYLNAMETGRFDQLPSAVQSKGMITNYTRFLDLDTDAILLRYAEGIQRNFTEKQAQLTVERKSEKTIPRKASAWKFIFTPDLMIGIFAVLSLVGFLVWSTTQIVNERKRELESNIPGISGILLENTVQSEAERQTQTAQATLDAPLQQTPSVNVITATIPLNPTITLAPQLSGPIQLHVVAYGRVYLEVIADGKTAFLGRTVAGNAYPFSANNQIELKTGDGSKIQVVYNQTPLGTLGQPLQPIDLIFTAEEIVTPTPMFTASPTVTPVPSRTPTLTVTPVRPTITPYIPKP